MKRITSGPCDGAGKAVGPRGGESDKQGKRGGGAPGALGQLHQLRAESVVPSPTAGS